MFVIKFLKLKENFSIKNVTRDFYLRSSSVLWASACATRSSRSERALLLRVADPIPGPSIDEAIDSPASELELAPAGRVIVPPIIGGELSLSERMSSLDSSADNCNWEPHFF